MSSKSSLLGAPDVLGEPRGGGFGPNCTRLARMGWIHGHHTLWPGIGPLPRPNFLWEFFLHSVSTSANMYYLKDTVKGEKKLKIWRLQCKTEFCNFHNWSLLFCLLARVAWALRHRFFSPIMFLYKISSHSEQAPKAMCQFNKCLLVQNIQKFANVQDCDEELMKNRWSCD